jgi:hypothetical protein
MGGLGGGVGWCDLNENALAGRGSSSTGAGFQALSLARGATAQGTIDGVRQPKCQATTAMPPAQIRSSAAVAHPIRVRQVSPGCA